LLSTVAQALEAEDLEVAAAEVVAELLEAAAEAVKVGYGAGSAVLAFLPAYTVVPGTSYTVTVGAGGVGSPGGSAGPGGSSADGTAGGAGTTGPNGGSSAFDIVTFGKTGISFGIAVGGTGGGAGAQGGGEHP